MVTVNGSGWESPLSSSITLSTPPSPRLKRALDASQETVFNNIHVPASTVVEYIASRKSSSSIIYVFDVAEQIGFGTLTKAWRKVEGSAPVVDLQTRTGAGLSLIGCLLQSTSADAGKKTTLTAYTTPAGLALMTPSFSYLPPPSAESRLVIQVPTVVAVGESLTLSPSLASLASAWPLLAESIVVLLSYTPQQAADFASLSYRIKGSHVIHLFDYYTSSRELGHTITPLPQIPSGSPAEIIAAAGYQFFDFTGDVNAHTTFVLLNGPLAVTLKALIQDSPSSGLAVVIVNVLRPWDGNALRRIIPSSVRSVHVFDDVPNASTHGNLYSDVLSVLCTCSLAVYTCKITPSYTHQLLNKTGALVQFINNIIPPFPIHLTTMQAAKRLLFINNPRESLTSLLGVVERLFNTESIQPRLLVDHDIFSKKGGISVNRLILSERSNQQFIPLSLEIPLEPSAEGSADFLAILDQNLLKSHHIFDLAKENSFALVATSWTPEEIVANLPSDVITSILSRNIAVFIINTKDVTTKLSDASGPCHDAVQSAITYITCLWFHLCSTASEPAICKLAESAFHPVIEGIPVCKIDFGTQAALDERAVVPLTESTPPVLRTIESNAIVFEPPDGETLVNGSRLGSWHDAAKHLLFPPVYAPDGTPMDNEEHTQNPSLRPDCPERTFLVTCTVNRRLTPLEYNRNVFHLEFDTSNTNLKYAIGEALGVHGWNDEQDVLDFCHWYGVNPNHLVTIPITGSDKYHTRTIFQALQQQIDLFGKPTKSFYTDLAFFAEDPVDNHALLFIGSPEGASTFKKYSEKNTVTFADVLKMYPSAKPGIEELCELVGDIKPRHYSIASSQAVVGDRVDLLVVTVDWVTSSGMFCVVSYLTSTYLLIMWIR